MNRMLLHAAILVAAAVCFIVYMMTGGGNHHAGQGLIFLIFGYAVGAYGTMVGAGGGFLIVPALLIFYHSDPAQAAGTALSVVFMNAVSGTLSYAHQKRIDYRAGLIFAIATIPGAISGAFFARAFSGRVFNLIFGIVLLSISMLLIWRPAADAPPPEHFEKEVRWWHRAGDLTDREGHVFAYHYNWVLGAIVSFFVGFMSSLLGIGGGIIHVPVLVYLLMFPPHLATATSHFILAITAGIGTITHISLGHVMMWPALLMGVGVIGGAQVGAVLGKRVRGPWLLRCLALALIVVAVRLFAG